MTSKQSPPEAHESGRAPTSGREPPAFQTSKGHSGGKAPDLSPEQLVQLQAVDFEIPDYRSLSNGERGGLGMEALEGYAYGERTRFDSQGRRWEFRREPKDDQFWLTITVSVGGLVLAHGALTLDRVAGKEGEEQLLALVEQLVEDAEVTGKVARAQQKALRETEAEEAREAQAQVAADQKAGTDAA